MWFILIIIGTAVWVYYDAIKLGAEKGRITGFFNLGAGAWFWVTLLLWIIGFPAWLITRGRYKVLNDNKKFSETELDKKKPWE
jgi:hypothetical protein